jgi:CRISPR-associated protein Csy1
VKQVYFPVENGYHLLSVLTPSGIMYKLKERIKILHFSDYTKHAREAKKKNSYHENGFSELYNLSVIGYGGTKPQNISVFNNQNGGTAYLLQSLPPELTSRTIHPPKTNFFSNTLLVYMYKDEFNKLHELIMSDINNIHIRNKRDRLIKNIIYRVIDSLWMVRYLDAGWSESESYRQLPQHQKVWLDQKYVSLRDENIDWLISVKDDFARWFIHTYIKVLGKKALGVGDEQLSYFKSMLSDCEEVLR